MFYNISGDNMKIKVIGSGSMWNEYNSACYLIDEDIMVDFPNGACKYLYRMTITPKAINYILITHFHGDHYFDIPFYILNKSKSNNKEANIYCSKEGVDKINQIGVLAFPNSYKDACEATNLKYNNNPKIKIKNYEIERVLVDHGRMKPAYGYIINKDNIKIGFTGDTALCKRVESMVVSCKYLFCDCMFVKGTKKHQGIDNIKYLTKINPECTFIVSHMENKTRSELKKLNIKNVIIPEDGDVIDIK